MLVASELEALQEDRQTLFEDGCKLLARQDARARASCVRREKHIDVDRLFKAIRGRENSLRRKAGPSSIEAFETAYWCR